MCLRNRNVSHTVLYTSLLSRRPVVILCLLSLGTWGLHLTSLRSLTTLGSFRRHSECPVSFLSDFDSCIHNLLQGWGYPLRKWKRRMTRINKLYNKCGCFIIWVKAWALKTSLGSTLWFLDISPWLHLPWNPPQCQSPASFRSKCSLAITICLLCSNLFYSNVDFGLEGHSDTTITPPCSIFCITSGHTLSLWLFLVVWKSL